MSVIFRVVYWTLFLPLLCFSCTIFTLATAELNNISETESSNNSLGLVKNETLPEGLPSPPVVPPLVNVIHGKVNSVVHEIHGSIDDISLIVPTEIKPDDNLFSATHINLSIQSATEGFLPSEQRPTDEVTNLTALEAPVSSTTESPSNVTTPGGSPDDIPSFSEWAKKHMAETHGRAKGENLTVGSGGAKPRFKNYASPDCGAKVVASNPEAISPSAILSSTRDDYMLNPCNVKIWFIVELCEPIQPQRIEIANFELFSSSPQELTVHTSDRFPSRDWAQTGALMARDERTVQSFQLPRVSHFVKYLKVELHSHYGSEHFCPISLFRAYGTSEIEVLDAVDGEEPDHENSDDEPVGESRDLLEELEAAAAKNKETASAEAEKTNLFGTAKAAVLSIVKKAAEVLVKSPGNQSVTCGQGGPYEYHQCATHGYHIVCTNCSENFYSKLYERLCCHGTELECLLSNPFIKAIISDTQLCNEIGLSWNVTSPSNITIFSPKVGYLKAILPRETIAALCNYHAVTRKQLALNITHEEPAVEEVPNPEMEVKIETTDEPVPDSEVESDQTKLIKPSKVVENEQTTPTTIEPIVEDTPLVVETKNSIAEPQPNINETSLPLFDHASNETNEKVIVEEGNATLVPEIKTKPVEGDEPIVDSLALDSLFPETEDEQLGGKGKQDDIEQEEAKTAATVTVQKESVFVRLANRIKALEMNMSLSSQYLEELSRRYKKQVEELQRNLNSVLEERRLAAERESMQAIQLAALTSKIEALSGALGDLLAERDSWSNKALVFGQHGLIVVLEVIGFVVVVWVWRRMGPNTPSRSGSQNTPHLTRRHSAEEPQRRNIVRRPSEEACLPSGSTHENLLTDGPKRKVSREGARKRKRRRKGGELVVIGGPDESWQPLQPAPEFMRTAAWQRGKRSSQTQTSSQEQLSISSDLSIKPKKTGAFRRIVKKLF